jgi:adenine/guanine phosphoribosyltransferase-like PRPP-binding protein
VTEHHDTLPDLFWQDLADEPHVLPPFQDRVSTRLPDGRWLLQPLRPLVDDPARGVASLISTQASFTVEHALTGFLVAAARSLAPEVVVGLPTLGHVFARAAAERLGFANWVALGYSRKLWYDAALSEPVTSSTSPDAGKRLWLDPRVLGRLRGRRVLVVDDVVSTGISAAAALTLLDRAGFPAVGVAVAMAQGNRWVDRLASVTVVAGFATPLFSRTADGWRPIEGTALLQP